MSSLLKVWLMKPYYQQYQYHHYSPYWQAVKVALPETWCLDEVCISCIAGYSTSVGGWGRVSCLRSMETVHSFFQSNNLTTKALSGTLRRWGGQRPSQTGTDASQAHLLHWFNTALWWWQPNPICQAMVKVCTVKSGTGRIRAGLMQNSTGIFICSPFQWMRFKGT